MGFRFDDVECFVEVIDEDAFFGEASFREKCSTFLGPLAVGFTEFASDG